MIEWESDGTRSINQEIYFIFKTLHIPYTHLDDKHSDLIQNEQCVACFGKHHGNIVMCSICKEYIHEHCYFQANQDIPSLFICDGCLAKKSGNNMKCQICEQSEGILLKAHLKSLVNLIWVHPACVNWSQKLKFSNDMSQIEGNWSSVIKMKWKVEKCFVCQNESGVRIKV